jgi:hypothetical protein
VTNLVNQLRLAERAEEDIYFARIDRELIDALHQQEQLGRWARAESGQRAELAGNSDELTAELVAGSGADTRSG